MNRLRFAYVLPILVFSLIAAVSCTSTDQATLDRLLVEADAVVPPGGTDLGGELAHAPTNDLFVGPTSGVVSRHYFTSATTAEIAAHYESLLEPPIESSSNDRETLVVRGYLSGGEFQVTIRSTPRPFGQLPDGSEPGVDQPGRYVEVRVSALR